MAQSAQPPKGQNTPPPREFPGYAFVENSPEPKHALLFSIKRKGLPGVYHSSPDRRRGPPPATPAPPRKPGPEPCYLLTLPGDFTALPAPADMDCQQRQGWGKNLKFDEPETTKPTKEVNASAL